DRIIYVVDMGQKLHFQMVFSAAKLAKYFDPKKVRIDHVDFGVVLGEDGKKFKTRSGETVKLIDLLREAIYRARDIMKERLQDADQVEIDHSAEILGINAIKYADLSCHRVKDYVFSYDRMLRFEGNTAAFLLYAYVRIQSIKRKVNQSIDQLMGSGSIQLLHPSEVALGLHLRQFQETLDIVSDELVPHRLTDYLYQLAEKFNAFFRDCHVQGTEFENSRLLLCELTARILEKGFHILGLKTMQRM
ncbi:MAG: arginine--tRNA ligase, partial [Simkaniaceae bacterium]|nr:arginine--tRNA ligase [Simkaniaceae bacterium]